MELIEIVEWFENGEIWIPWSDVQKIYKVSKRELYQAVHNKKVRTIIIENYNHPRNKEFIVYAIEDLTETFPIRLGKEKRKTEQEILNEQLEAQDKTTYSEKQFDLY